MTQMAQLGNKPTKPGLERPSSRKEDCHPSRTATLLLLPCPACGAMAAPLSRALHSALFVAAPGYRLASTIALIVRDTFSRL
jgi:hypothetical protein